ncbi:beta-lactamase [Lysobacter arseniciresistens ZS79]|uniref:Beta-lactamase n=1 Tax=Lysobacter arseniciresistens ZS79 TaxID=913325 RepID=A0A0A0F3Z4_9GAMM|nr:MBL fold metallo-hydrolase [Lysobacter arseniciresistens]KGM57554.1 beta-lactamase [Lysobacter arseniciresistens ZS79]
MSPLVQSFHDPATATFTHVVYDRAGGHAAVIDPVLDYDPASARTSTASADAVLAFTRTQRLTVEWVLETHAHADHLTAAAHLKRETGAKVAIGRGIRGVQSHFAPLFGLGPEFATDGRQFDRLLDDGDTLAIGDLEVRVVATPGHTADSVTYVVDDAAFVGDTLFAPDTGTARTDFPGGDARTLYRSIRRLLDLPAGTRLFLCHDYPPDGRGATAQFSPDDQRRDNIHVGDGVDEDAFVEMRRGRDATLPVPRLILPALQVNIAAGELPPADANGIRHLRLPLDRIGGGA